MRGTRLSYSFSRLRGGALRAGFQELTGRVMWLLAWVVLLGACTSTQWKADHIDRGINRLSQEEVVQLFGPPDATRALQDGESLWVYRYSYSTIRGTAMAGTTHCWENRLRFDREKILRERQRGSCE